MRKRFTLHIAVLVVVLTATCAFAGVPPSAAMASTNMITAVAHTSLAWDTANIAATGINIATTGIGINYESAAVEATTVNTANTGAHSMVIAGTALVNSTINLSANIAGASNVSNASNSAGVGNKAEQSVALNAVAVWTVNGAPRKALNQISISSAAGKVIIRTG